MRKINTSNNFKKDYKKAIKRNKEMDKLKKLIELLANDQILPDAYRDHALVGNFSHFRDCHIEPDWLLIYRKENEDLLFLEATGTHSDLFK